MKRLAFLLGCGLALLFLSGCGATPGTLVTMTPVPRTPRATATATRTPTPTGTPVPTPAATSALTIWEGLADCSGSGTPAPLSDAQTSEAELVDWSHTICIPAGESAQITLIAEGAGAQDMVSQSIVNVAGGDVTCAETNPDPCSTSSCTLSNVYEMAPGATFVRIFQEAGGLHLTCDTHHTTLSYTIVPQNPALHGNGPTPTPAAGCAITEVYTRYGVSCQDYNLRGGCGNDDEYVEVECTPAQSLAGWQLAASDVLTYTIASDNMTGPLKVFFLDQWPTWAITSTLPLTGTATLINAAATPISTRTWQTIPGTSWAAKDWTNPAGLWWYYAPSPGY